MKHLRTREAMQNRLFIATEPKRRSELLDGLQSLPSVEYVSKLYTLESAGKDTAGSDSPLWYEKAREGLVQIMAYDTWSMTPEQTALYVDACRAWNK